MRRIKLAFGISLCAACIAQDLSLLDVRRIPIEKRWDRQVPSTVPEVPALLREFVFYGNQPNHQILNPGEKAYLPLREGGFYIENGTRYFNRPLFYKGNMIGTGDRPMFLITRGFGKQWAAKLRFAVKRGSQSKWLDEFPTIRTEFRPGNVQYVCTDPALAIMVRLTVAAALEGWSSLFNLEVGGKGADGAEIGWVFGDVVNERGHKDQMWWLPARDFGHATANRVSPVSKDAYRISLDPTDERWRSSISQIQLRTLEFYAGSRWSDQEIMAIGVDAAAATSEWRHSVDGKLIACKAPLRQSWRGTMVVTWGGEPNATSLSRLEADMKRLNLEWGDRLYREWYDNFVGRGAHPRKSFESVLAAPEKALSDAAGFWEQVRKRIVFEIPDEEINSWANWLVATQEYLHWPLGQMSSLDVWGQQYLHISNMYSGWDYLGIHDQQQKWLRLFATSVRNGWIGLYHGIAPWARNPEIAHGGEEDQIAHYVNYVYTHWLWTADDQFVRDVWPYIRQLLDRELIQNDPDGDGLFAARYPYWGPENDSWGPKSGLQSAQMLRALRGAAELAKVAADPDGERRYSEHAAKVEGALPQLWDRTRGVLGSRDPLDVLHISPGASEIFLPILRGAVTPLEAYQMLRYVRQNLWSEVYPGTARIWLCGDFGGKHHLGPLPDVAWSTVAAAAVTGDMDHFYPVLKTYAHSYFFSSWPGGECSGVSAWGAGSAGMNDHNDGRMPALYLLGRGLFGLEPDLPRNRLVIEPRFPSQWNRASIQTPDLHYRFEQTANQVTLHVSSSRSLKKVLRIPVTREVASVAVDGKKADYRIEAGIHRALVVVETPAVRQTTVIVTLSGPPMQLNYSARQVLGMPFRISVEGADAIELVDPQEALRPKASGARSLEAVPLRLGNRTAFLKASRGALICYLPLDLKVEEAFAILAPSLDPANFLLRFTLLNRSDRSGRMGAQVKFAGNVQSVDVDLSGPGEVPVSLPFAAATLKAITPGSNPLEVEIAGQKCRHDFVDWTLPTNDWFSRTLLLDLAWDYHEEASSLFNTKFYYDAWQMGIDYPVLPPGTYEWAGHRIENPKIVSTRFLASAGIPFYLASERKLGGMYQSAEGGGPRNVLPIANWRPGLYPSNLAIPVEGMKLAKAYFLAYSWQRGKKTYHPNVELVANYQDGTTELRQLIPPYSFMPQYGLKSANQNVYHAEVIDSGLPIGKQKEAGWYLSSGEQVQERADIYDLPLDPTRPLRSIQVRSVSTESIFAIFGITLVRTE